ncbi:MAG: hypothetical protein FWB78_10630 [Treponema sp.]|nr:hypothetical protein [Treponema sp.]
MIGYNKSKYAFFWVKVDMPRKTDMVTGTFYYRRIILITLSADITAAAVAPAGVNQVGAQLLRMLRSADPAPSGKMLYWCKFFTDEYIMETVT